MTEMPWFSAKTRRVCLVEGEGCAMANDSIHVFQAADFKDAFRRALELGRGQEEEYWNEDGRLVRWRLKEIQSLDIVQGNSLDGAEVHSSFEEFEPAQDFDVNTVFSPEESKPDQTFLTETEPHRVRREKAQDGGLSGREVGVE